MNARRSLTGLTLRQGGARSLPRHLAREGGQETRVVVQVARQEPARLLDDPVRPLEPALLHPAWRLRDPPGMEVEGRAHAAHHRYLDAVAHARHPLLLLRDADPDPQHIRA